MLCALWGAAVAAVLAGRAAMLDRAGGGGLLEDFAAVADPRSRRGVRQALPTILGLCTAAVLSGCQTLVEITDWVTHADQELLAALDVRHDSSGRYVPPHPDTVERVFHALGPQGLADQLGAYLGRQAGIGPVGAALAGPALLAALAIDGKAVKGGQAQAERSGDQRKGQRGEGVARAVDPQHGGRPTVATRRPPTAVAAMWST